jgi:hypothetical protein
MTQHIPHHPDELSPDQKERMCPSCRVRYLIRVPAPRDLYGPLDINRGAYRWLENAAKVWDAQSDERFPASEFIAWLRFDLAGVHPLHIDHDGAPPHTESGEAGSRASVHRRPDPLPYFSRPRKLRTG